MQPVSVVIAEGDEDIAIKISDMNAERSASVSPFSTVPVIAIKSPNVCGLLSLVNAIIIHLLLFVLLLPQL